MDIYFCNKKIEIKSKQIEETGKAFMRTHAQNVFQSPEVYYLLIVYWTRHVALFSRRAQDSEAKRPATWSRTVQPAVWSGDRWYSHRGC